LKNENPTSTACPLCASAAAAVIGEIARDGSPLATVLCEGCGLARTDPLPDPEELASFYRDNYRLLYKRTYQPKPYHVLRAARVALERFERMRELVGADRDILDAGCGGGEFLYLLRAAGCRVTGVEPNAGYAAYAHDQLGLDVHIGLIGEQPFPPGSFDGITLFHVLEHLPAPVESLARLAVWLRPRGFLAVEVPNFESTCEHPAHRFHRAHLFYFSLATLTRCGELAGLSLVRSETSPDGGNLLVVFRADPGRERPSGLIPGAFERLCRMERRRAAWKYWLSPGTYGRGFRRLWRMAEERLAARRHTTGRAILDSVAGRMAGKDG
jgi:SAM-dependent methyltransferase